MPLHFLKGGVDVISGADVKMLWLEKTNQLKSLGVRW